MTMTRGERFRVARRWSGTPYDLVREQGQLLLRGFYEPITPWLRAIGYALFALTDDQPDRFQEVRAGDLLEVLEVARGPAGVGESRFYGQHYRDAFDALERLFNVV